MQREYLKLSIQTTQNLKEIVDLKQSLYDVENKVANVVDSLMLDFGNSAVRRDYLVLNGQPTKADLAYGTIYSQAKRSIYAGQCYPDTTT